MVKDAPRWWVVEARRRYASAFVALAAGGLACAQAEGLGGDSVLDDAGGAGSSSGSSSGLIDGSRTEDAADVGVGSGSSSSSGSGGSSGSTSSSGGGAGSGSSGSDSGCTINPSFSLATCPACATCLQPYCCEAVNDCYADPGCSAVLACFLACYSGSNPQSCGIACMAVDASATSVGLYSAYDTCVNAGLGRSACNGSGTAACVCH